MNKRVIVVYLVAWPLFWIGDLCSRIMDGFGFAKVYGRWPTHYLYRPYNWCMVTSNRIEKWAGTEIIWQPAPPSQTGEV